MRMIQQQVAPGFFVQQQVQVDSKEYCKIDNTHVDIEIEKGMSDGDEIVIERMAEQRPGIVPGNVIVRLRQQPHPTYTRAGNDLKTSMTVPLSHALLGFEKSLVQLDSSTIILNRNNAITQPGQVIRMDGQGMPAGTERGALFVTVNVEFPKQLTREQKDMISKVFLQETSRVIRTTHTA
jgi:DnaJ-class molecular chaperone